jgi:hypothetical protein
MSIRSAGEDGVEGAGELRVTVLDQELDRVGSVGEVHDQVAGLLRGTRHEDPGNAVPVQGQRVLFGRERSVEMVSPTAQTAGPMAVTPLGTFGAAVFGLATHCHSVPS